MKLVMRLLEYYFVACKIYMFESLTAPWCLHGLEQAWMIDSDHINEREHLLAWRFQIKNRSCLFDTEFLVRIVCGLIWTAVLR
jgi:hypothetical protein